MSSSIPFARFAKRIGLFVFAAFGQVALTEAAPLSHTHDATPLGLNTFVLRGMAVPNGTTSSAWFEWGQQGGFTATTQVTNVGSGRAVVWLTATISNLTPTAVYQTRLVVSNSTGIKYGATRWFTPRRSLTAWGAGNYGETVAPLGAGKMVSAVAGSAVSLAIKLDGSVSAWGYNGTGQTDVPNNLTNVSMVDAGSGSSHSLALRHDGSLVAWGFGQYGQANVPVGLSNVVIPAAGIWHSAALKSDGRVVCWGRNNYGQLNSSSFTNVVSLAVGGYHSLALKADGTVVVWGWHGYGQTNVPAGLSNVVMVASGYAHNLALRADGTVVGWGWDSYGQASVPVGLSNVISIACGSQHSVALKTDGTLVGWGESSYGITTTPAEVTNIVSVSAGGAHNLVLADNIPPQALEQSVRGGANNDLIIQLRGSDRNGDSLSYRITTLPAVGNLFQCVDGNRGTPILAANTLISDPLGRVIFAPAANGYGDPYASFSFVANDGEADSTPAPVSVSIDHLPYVVTQHASDLRPTTATLQGMVLANGFATTAWFEWGERGALNQLTLPELAGSSGNVVRISVALSNLLAGRTYQFRLNISNVFGIKQGGWQQFTTGERLVVWGSNGYGDDVPPSDLHDVVAADSFYTHSLALRSDGKVLAWGDGSSGQLNVPVGLSNVVMVSAGYYHSLALQSNGLVTAWGGSSTYGSMSPPPGLSNVIAIASGYAHNLALRSDGTVCAWGYNGQGQTDVPIGLNRVVAVAAGFNHSLALQIDGTVVVFGGSDTPVDLQDVVEIASKWNFSLARRADGTVFSWGGTAEQEVPENLSNVVALACGSSHSLALQADGKIQMWGTASVGTGPEGMGSAAGIAAGAATGLALANVRPQSQPMVVHGPANHDLVITLEGSDANRETLSFRILTLPQHGALYQCNEGTRGALIASTNTPVSDPAGRVVFVPVPEEFGNPYASFTFLVSDGAWDSVPAQVTIDIQSSRAFTQSPDDIHADQATLHGIILPNSFAAMAWFEWAERGGDYANDCAHPCQR
ncbi:MAG: hypothetical protein QM813_03710 [Verrucomicrobiota bacterium]